MKTADPPPSSVAMTIRALVTDPVSNMPVVILQTRSDGAMLPIWIGVCEANSIALKLENVATPRPMTHDLIRSLIATLGYSVDHVFIHSLNDSVFLASIQVRDQQGTVHQIDSRPSDALAVAIRAEAAIFVSDEVLSEARLEEGSAEDAIRMILERMRPEDLGEYEM